MEVLLLYGCDTWHTDDSRFLIGVFARPERLELYLECMQEEGILSDYDLTMLREQKQTQGRETNYIIEIASLDPIYPLDPKP